LFPPSAAISEGLVTFGAGQMDASAAAPGSKKPDGIIPFVTVVPFGNTIPLMLAHATPLLGVELFPFASKFGHRAETPAPDDVKLPCSIPGAGM
jgi:hypothetical protein